MQRREEAIAAFDAARRGYANGDRSDRAAIWFEGILDERDAMERAVQRGIALVETLLPYVMWDALDGESDESRARAALQLMRNAVNN